MCVNPLIDIVDQGVLSETSASCEDRLLEESGLVHAEFKNCKKLVKDTLAKRTDLSTWKGSTFNLKSDGAQVERLYQDRKRLGKIYDDFFNVWLSTHNDGLAACAYSTNYMSFYEELSDGYLKNLDDEKQDITDHCTKIPTMQSFDVTKANVNEEQRAAASLGAPLDSTNPCYDAVEAISGIRMQAESTHSKRAQCLEFYCESVGRVLSCVYLFHSPTTLARFNLFPPLPFILSTDRRRVTASFSAFGRLPFPQSLSREIKKSLKDVSCGGFPAARFTTLICPRRDKTL